MSVDSSRENAWGLLGHERVGGSLHDRVSELYVESREDVYRYLLTLGLEPARAQEAAQEVFLRLYATLRKGESIDNPRAWIFRVAHNYGLKIRMDQTAERGFDPELEAKLVADTQTPE